MIDLPTFGFGPLFRLGKLVATPGAAALFEGQPDRNLWLKFLERHAYGDWGELDEEDCSSNNHAMTHGDRLLSAYTIAGDQRIWIITEADRSVTTFLLPDEY